jgi:acyl carrier protein
MGLDIVEITLEIEEAFNISFSQDDLQELVRDQDIVVGDLYEAILKKLHLRDVGRHSVRLNFALWMELRRSLQVVTGLPPEDVLLKTPLADLFPKKGRRAKWSRLREACSYRVLELDYPRVVRVVGFSLAGAMVFMELFQVWQFPGLRWLWPALGLFGIWMLVETYTKLLAFLGPLRTAFPSGMTTVKDLCRAVLAANYSEICEDACLPIDDRSVAVWQQLTQILADQLGVEVDRVTFRSRLIRDLGME